MYRELDLTTLSCDTEGELYFPSKFTKGLLHLFIYGLTDKKSNFTI